MDGVTLNDVMVDLETLGRKAGCVIVSIGAVKFDPLTGFVDEANSFYRAITVESAMRFGLHVDPGTLKWWMQQSDAARAVFNDSEAVGIQQALVEFAEWVAEDGDCGSVKMWGNGASFDNSILSAAYEAVDILQPWNFWNDRCYRTIKALNPQAPFVREGTHHNAVDDAVSQAKHLVSMFPRDLLDGTAAKQVA